MGTVTRSMFKEALRKDAALTRKEMNLAYNEYRLISTDGSKRCVDALRKYFGAVSWHNGGILTSEDVVYCCAKDVTELASTKLSCCEYCISEVCGSSFKEKVVDVAAKDVAHVRTDGIGEMYAILLSARSETLELIEKLAMALIRYKEASNKHFDTLIGGERGGTHRA